MSMQALPADLPRRVKVRIIVTSLLRVAIGLAFIFGGLALIPESPDRSAVLPISIVFVGVAIYVWFFRRQLRRIQASRYPFIQASEALVLVAAMFLALFSTFYVTISVNEPSAFTAELDHFTAYYYALTVLATVGFGDITPVSDLARLVSMIQMAIDIVFVAAVLRVLMSAASSRQKSQERVQDTPS